MRRIPSVFAALAVVASGTRAKSALCAEYMLSPGVDQATVVRQLDGLKPGDTLTFAPGQYPGIDRDLKHADGSGIAGTPSARITIRGISDASGALPHIVADTTQYQEAIRIRAGSAYLLVQGLHLSNQGRTTQAGITFNTGVHDIEVRDNLIEHVTGIGIQMHSQSDIHDVLVEHNEIHHTGTNTSDGSNGGQGFQAGGFEPEHATKNVFHLVVRGNLIHDIGGQEGECIALLYGVYASTIEDNVTRDCPRGVSGETENYGIIAYGSGLAHYAKSDDDILIQRNFVYGSAARAAGHENVAIYVGPGTRVINNIVVASNQGIAARLESEVPDMKNVRILHNTVYDASLYAFSIRGTQKADASVVVAGNAFVAVQAMGYGYRMPDPLGGAVVKANYYAGLDYAEAPASAMSKLPPRPARSS